jgi:hypothetical protein
MKNGKNIVKKIIFLVVLIGGLNTLFSYLYYKKFAVKKPYFKQEKRFQKVSSDVETLILGHSRAAFGIKDSLLGKAFNFATYGENNVYTYYKLKTVVENHPNQIKRIIIPIGLSTFFSNSRTNMADHSYWNRYLDYNELGEAHQDRGAYLSAYLQSKLTPYVRMLTQEINKKDDAYKKEKTKLSALKSVKEKYQFALESVSHNFDVRNYYDTISLNYLNRMLDFCELHNIEVVAIRFPVTPYYIQAFETKMQANQIDEQPFMLAMKSHGIEILAEENYFEGDESKFKDVHHLTPEASKEFTQYVMEKLN